MGVTLIDMGGATTGIAVFHNGNLVHSSIVPIGGQHITNDIARGLVDDDRPCRAHEDNVGKRHLIR